MGLTVAEAADRLGVKTRRVHNLIEANKLAAERVQTPGRSPLSPILMVDEGSLAAYEASKGTNHSGGVAARYATGVEERDEMDRGGWMTVAAAAKEVGVTGQYIRNLAYKGKIASEMRGIMWVKRDEAMRMKRERERKLAAMG